MVIAHSLFWHYLAVPGHMGELRNHNNRERYTCSLKVICRTNHLIATGLNLVSYERKFCTYFTRLLLCVCWVAQSV